MTDRPTKWPETADITVRLRAKRGEWTCIREEAACEIEKLRKANLRLLGEVSSLTEESDQWHMNFTATASAMRMWEDEAENLRAKLAIAVEALEELFERVFEDGAPDDVLDRADEALAKIRETK